MPLGELRPSLRLKLARSVRRDHAASVDHGRECPQNDPSHQSGLAGSMTGGDRDPNRLPDWQAVANAAEDVALPFIRSCMSGEIAFAPGKHDLDEAQRISCA